MKNRTILQLPSKTLDLSESAVRAKMERKHTALK
jgi:hypothetical protein